MTTELRQNVEITGKQITASIKVNGHQLICASATLEMDATVPIPVLTVRLPINDDMVISLEGAKAVLDEESRAALAAMGWTPPDGG